MIFPPEICAQIAAFASKDSRSRLLFVRSFHNEVLALHYRSAVLHIMEEELDTDPPTSGLFKAIEQHLSPLHKERVRQVTFYLHRYEDELRRRQEFTDPSRAMSITLVWPDGKPLHVRMYTWSEFDDRRRWQTLLIRARRREAFLSTINYSALGIGFGFSFLERVGVRGLGSAFRVLVMWSITALSCHMFFRLVPRCPPSRKLFAGVIGMMIGHLGNKPWKQEKHWYLVGPILPALLVAQEHVVATSWGPGRLTALKRYSCLAVGVGLGCFCHLAFRGRSGGRGFF